MNPQVLIPAAIFAFSSLAVLSLGYRIKVRKQVSLISGTNASKVKDPETLASSVGGGLLTLGWIDLIISLSMIPFSSFIALLIGVYCLVSMIGAIIVFTRSRKFMA